MEQVVLVDEKDRELGLMEKEAAHQNGGRLHRAISVVLFRRRSGGVEVLLQKRAKVKSRWPGYWTNTVCTDVRQGESFLSCGVRRLEEEMGVKLENGDLRLVFKQVYRFDYDSKWSEYEVAGVMVGEWDGKVEPDETEVAGYKWWQWQKLVAASVLDKEKFTPWFLKMLKDERLAKALGEG